MNFYFLFFAATSTTTTTSAFLTTRHYCPTTTTTKFVSTFSKAAASNDDGDNNNDDWFADFDDFESEIDAKLSSNSNQRQFAQTTATTRPSSSFVGHRSSRDHKSYTRDTSRDTSNVDESAVQSLLQERRQAQQCRDYDTADQIRDLLMNEHNVGVNDRERTWRTGCSSSGSGSKFGGQGRGGGRRERDFGPNGHDYSAIDNSNDLLSGTSFSEEEIHAKLAQRLQAKLNRRYREADDIQEELMENGVYVDDGQKMWRADGQSFIMDGGGGGGRRRDYYGGDNNNNRRNDRRSRNDYNNNNSNMGPHGHDYNESPNAGPNNSILQEEEIHSLLAQRLRAKKAHDFRTADAIQQELIEGGVFVHDAQKEWRADGKPFDSLGTSVQNRRDPTIYTQSAYSEDVLPEMGLSSSTIEKLCAERIQFKLAKQYDKADAIRDGLQQRYNVLLDDRIQEWSLGGNFGEDRNAQRHLSRQLASREYTKSVDSGDLENPQQDEARVMELLRQRQEFKSERNYQQADEIRDMLREEFNVYVEDKLRVWSVGRNTNNFANDKPQQNTQRPTSREYTLRGNPGKLTPEEVQYIETALRQRQDAKKNRNFDVADEIRDELMHDYNIAVDDRNLEWKVDNDEYVVCGSAANLTPDTLTHIQTQLSKRFAFKQQRLYQDADIIRDELREEYGVVINDRQKEWYVDDNDNNNYNNDDDDGYTSLGRNSNHPRSFDASSSAAPDDETTTTTRVVELTNNNNNDNDDNDNNDDEQSVDDKLDQAFDAMFDDLDIIMEEEDEEDNDNDIVVADDDDDDNIKSSNTEEETLLHDDDDDDMAQVEAATDYYDTTTTTTTLDHVVVEAAAEEEENESTTNNNNDNDSLPQFSEEELSSLTVPRLKEELRKVGLPVSGRKAELVARLLLA